MNQRNFSFSVKTKEDLDFVTQLKLKVARRGGNFSFVVIDALKKLEQEKPTNVKAK